MTKEQQHHKSAYIVGNWKMNMTIAEARAFISAIALSKPADATHVGFAVPFTMLVDAAEAARGSSISIGSQDISANANGAFTGEVSAEMVVDAGGTFSLIGHSERRMHHHESDELINRKLQMLLKTRLNAILCVGETKEQRDRNETKDVIKSQLAVGLKGISSAHSEKIAIAYEPVWAIGSGQTPTPEQVQEIHAYCRSLILSVWGEESSKKIPILYGGSVKPENSAQILSQPDVNGLLVGGASLDVQAFSKILHARIENIAT